MRLLCSVCGSSAQESHGHTRVSPAEGHQDGQRAEALDIGGKTGRAGLFNLKKNRLRLGELIAVFIYLTGK